MAVLSGPVANSSIASHRSSGIVTDHWYEWQAEVVAVVRQEFGSLFHSVHSDDFDWDAWRPLFDDGHRPDDAVRQSLSEFELTWEGKVGSEAVKPSAFEPGSAMHLAVD